MINRDEDFRFWRQFSHYDLSLRVAELHRQRRDLSEKMTETEVQATRRAIAHVFLSGRGIEVGAGARPVPVPENAIVSYGDIREEDDLLQYFRNVADPQIPEGGLIDAQTFAGVADASLDFVITAHVIEHMADPVGSIANALRVLKPGGRYLLIVPDMAHTFDRDRPETTVEHVLADYQDGGNGTLGQAYREWLFFAHPMISGEHLDPQDIENRVPQCIEAKVEIHFHAWTSHGFRQMLDALADSLGFRILCQIFCINENIFVLERQQRPKHNPRFFFRELLSTYLPASEKGAAGTRLAGPGVPRW
jgi:SAM-dependent methyltransferase